MGSQTQNGPATNFEPLLGRSGTVWSHVKSLIFYACMLFHGKKKNIHKNQCCFVNQYQKFSKVEAIFPTDCLSLMQKSLLIQIVSRKNWKLFLASKQITNWYFLIHV